jgi:gas vesicle protein
MKNFIKGIFTGVVIGAIGGILLAPKSGKETRKDLQRTYSTILKDIRERLSVVQDLTEETYNSLVNSVVSEYQKAQKISQDQVEEITTLLREKWNQVKNQE